MMELCDSDVKMEDEDLVIILLASLPLSYENFASSLSVSKDSITLEEVKSSLYSRELQLMTFRNSDEASTTRISVIGSTNWLKKKKGRDLKKSKVDLKNICN